MSRIKTALTRKFGPLPAWAWGAIAFGVIFFYRRYRAASSGTGTGSVTPTAAQPQDPVTLQPGESVYDPNTGGLTTAPGGGGGGDGTTTPTDPGSGNNPSGDNQPPGGNTYNIFPPGSDGKGHPFKPKRPKGVPKNAKWGGPHSPGKGWRGIGGGWWLPPAHKGKGRGRGRSTGTTRTATGGRTTGRHKGTHRKPPVRGTHPGGKGKGRATASGGAGLSRYARQRPTTPIVSHVSNQRRVGGMQPGPRRPQPAVQHRPSAPVSRAKPRVILRRRKK